METRVRFDIVGVSQKDIYQKAAERLSVFYDCKIKSVKYTGINGTVMNLEVEDSSSLLDHYVFFSPHTFIHDGSIAMWQGEFTVTGILID